VLAAVPAVEVRLQPDRARVRRPHRERRAGHVTEGAGVVVHPGPEHLPELLVPALVDEVQVDLAERRQETERVVDHVLVAAVGDHEPVVGYVGHRQHADPDALVLVAQLHLAAVPPDGHPRGQRLQRAHGHRAVVRVRTQHAVRVAVLAVHHLGELVGADRLGSRLGGGRGVLRGHATPILATAWRGIATQVGRLRVSYTVS
jgi:hypothetical protein